ncbi:hypothetical protein Tco_0843486 [Tanacetum coccineum]|uniref:Uncharacterized protein n=1 Tax=Tanacetum coccineum TaxID=301880 RepID=A0ABQ5B803_9ASTR
MDALALTPCYFVFLTTTDVLEVYMHQFWYSVHKHDTSYRFRMDRKKKLYLNLETFRDIFQICPRVHGQDFDELPTDEVIVSFFKELGHTVEIKSITDVVVDQMHQPWRTFATIIKKSLSGRTTGLDKLRVTPPKKARKFKKLASPKLTNVPTLPKEPTKKSKRVKRPANSRLALTEEARVKEVRKKSMRDFNMTHLSDSGKVTKIPPSAAKIKSPGRDKDDSNNDHDSSSEGSDQENDSGDDNTQSDKEKGSDFEQETDENETGFESDEQENEEEVEDDEEEKEDEFVKTPSNYTPIDDEDETNEESKVKDNAEGDEDKGMDYTTNQFDDDMDVMLNDPVHADEGFVQKEGTDAEMINVHQGNENLEITLNQVIEDTHVTIYTIAKKTEVPITSSSYSSDLAATFLNFADMPPTDAEIVSPMDVHVQHEVPSTIPQSSPSFTPPPPLSTPTPPPTTEATNPLSALPDFTSVFQFNNRVSALEKEVFELRKDDLLNTQVTTLVDEHLYSRLGATRDEFMRYLSASITARITEQVKIQLPQILPREVSNCAPSVIQSMVTESLEYAVLAKESSQPQSTYKADASLIEFELKKILIDKMDKSQSYLTATPHRECYDGLIKSYDLYKSLFSSYDKVYSLKRSREDKDKDEDPSARSDRGLKIRKTRKDVEPTKGPKTKESKSGTSKGTKSQSKSSRKLVQAVEPEFEVADSDMPQNQEWDLGNDDEEPIREVASKHDWFTKPKQPQEPTNPNWNVGKTPQQGPTQSWLMTLASTADKPSKTFDELMSTPIDFSTYIMIGLKITKSWTQKTLLGPAFKLLKGTCTNFAELEYDFEECYKALSEKLDWDNPEGGDYPFDLTKPLPLVMNGNRQIVPVDYFFNNDLKYLQGGISTMTYTTSTTKTKAAQSDLLGIEDMVPNIWSPIKVAYDKHAKLGISQWREQRKTFYAYARGLESSHNVYSTKRIMAVTRVEVMWKHGYGYLREIEVQRADNEIYTFKEVDFLRIRINDIEDML